eukprot:gene12759-16010_t
MSPRSSATLTVIGEKVYMFGGQAKGGPPPPRHSHCAGAVANQCLVSLRCCCCVRCLHQEVDSDNKTNQTRSKVLCDAAVFDASTMKWTATEPTPFTRCAHTGVTIPKPGVYYGSMGQSLWVNRSIGQWVDSQSSSRHVQPQSEARATSRAPQSLLPIPSTPDRWTCPQEARKRLYFPAFALSGPQANGHDESSNGTSSTHCVLIYGGFSGEAVSGDMLCIDGQSLDIEQLHRGPRDDDAAGTVPQARFAHGAVCIPWPAGSCGQALLIFGGVNPAEDLNDVAVWVQD